MVKYNIISKTPYEEIKNLLSEEAKTWFERTFRPKKRGIGIVKTEEAKKWGTKEYYIARMVQFMTEPWDNMPVIAQLFSSGWTRDEVKLLDEVVNEITQAVWTWLKNNDPDLFREIARQTEHVCNLYGVNNIITL